MNYTTKFDIGQTVWAVRSQTFNYIVKCLPCRNTGEIKIGDETFICPKCNGRAAHQQWGGEKFYVYDSSRIGEVRVEDKPFRDIDRDKPNPQFLYMLESTGIGSGQIWEEDHLFATREEAEAFCDRRNGILPKDETTPLESPIDRFGRVVQH